MTADAVEIHIQESSRAAHHLHDVKLTPFTILRYAASIGLLIFSVVIVGALIFTGNTRVASETNPWVALIVCVSSLEQHTFLSSLVCFSLKILA